MTTRPTARWLTAQQAAEHCQVNIETIYRACQTGGLRHTRLMGRWKLRFLEVWLDEWLAKYATINLIEDEPPRPSA